MWGGNGVSVSTGWLPPPSTEFSETLHIGHAETFKTSKIRGFYFVSTMYLTKI